MSTAGTIRRRTLITGVNNPAYQISKDVANDSLVIDTAAPDGSVLVRDSAQADGWGFEAQSALAAPAGTLTGATLAGNVLASSLTSVGTLTALTVTAPIVGSVTGAAGSVAASTLTGATLASNVLASSLTSLGTIASLAATLATVTRDNLVVTSTDGLVLQNTTAATAGVQVQIAPRLRLRSQVWNTTATAASNTDDWIIESVPVSGAAPTGLLKMSWNGQASGLVVPMTLNGGGAVTLIGGLAVGAATYLFFTGRAQIRSPADGQLNLMNAAQTAGAGLDVATDSVLKVRTRAQTGYGTIDALGYRASGAAGVSFGPGMPTSMTFVNGILTAAS